jgi:hypothetical protein
VLCDSTKHTVTVEFSKKRGEAIARRLEAQENLEVIVGNLKDIKFTEKFDYIVAIGIFEYIPIIYKTENSYKDFLIYLKSLLNPNGKILMATSNKFGMRNWSAINDNPESLEYEFFNREYSENEPRLFSKNELEKLFEETNLGERKYYYPLPDYKYTNIIFSDEYLPSKGNLHRNIALYNDLDIINFHENRGYLKIVENNSEDFKFFANSYFIEISNSLKNNDIKLVSYWNNRNSKYRLRTVMKSDAVYKTATNELSKEHIETMKKNLDILKQSNIKTIDEYKENVIISHLVKMKQYDDFAIEEGKKYGKNRLLELINIFYKNVIDKLEEVNPDKNVFDYFGIEYNKEEIFELHFVKNGLWDLNPQNAFVDGEEIYVYDQEWYLENVPKEFIIYRGILIWSEIDKYFNKIELFEKLGLLKYKELFDKLEEAVSNSIMYKHINALWNKPQRNIRGLLVQNAKLEERLKDTETKLLEKEEEIKALENNLKIIENSTSWKVTKPLREISKHLK